MSEVNRLDRHVPLGSRVFQALMKTCDAKETCAGCFPCGRRYEAVMQAFSFELDLISRHDAVVATVVRDRIIESKKAERYRLAWLSAKRGRTQERLLREATSEAHAETWDNMERHRENASMNARDFRVALAAAERWKSKADRYHLAWLSAKRGRKSWRELYVKLISKSIRQTPAWWEDCTCGRLAVGLTVTEARNWNPDCPDHGVKSPWYNSEEQIDIRNLRQENSQLWQRLATVTRHDHAHRGQLQEMESELADLRLAFSELQGAQAREMRNAEIPGVVACYNTTHCASWGFCHRCAPQLYAEILELYRAGVEFSTNPSQLYKDVIRTVVASRHRGEMDLPAD